MSSDTQTTNAQVNGTSSNRQTSAYQTLWSSMAYTGVTGIGGKTVGDARIHQEAALEQIQGIRSGASINTAAIVAGGRIRTNSQMAQMGIPLVNRFVVAAGLQSASYEVRYSSSDGMQLRINIDSTIWHAPIRTRVTFSEGVDGEWVRASGDIGYNTQPRRLRTQSSNVGGFVGLGFTSEAAAVILSGSAALTSPVDTRHGGSVDLTFPLGNPFAAQCPVH